MPAPVVLALTLVGGVAVVIFLSSRRRLSTWLLIASFGLFVAGGVMWAHEPAHPQTPATMVAAVAPAARLAPAEAVAGDVYQGESTGEARWRDDHFSGGDTAVPIDTGSGPNHLPAGIVLALAGAVGVIGLVLKRRTPRADA